MFFNSAVFAADCRDVWIVSTRDAPNCGDLDPSEHSLCYERLEGCRWLPGNSEEFHSGIHADKPVVVFIHGNRTDASDAIWKGCYTYEVIRAQSPNKPFRYVIWSWTADRIYRRNNDDIRLKAVYSDAQSYYLAHWLDRLDPGVKVCLIGHSFGPRIITGALHLLGGGDVAGRVLPDETVAAWKQDRRNPIRAVLLAAAIDADWLSPDGCHGRALAVADRMLATRNACDRVLRWYPRLYECGGGEALGFIGPCGVVAGNLEITDVSASVGKFHDWRGYSTAPSVCCRWPYYAFLEDLPVMPEPQHP